jgi:hypothetical protein
MQNATLRLPLRLLILLLLALRVTAQPQTYPGLVRQPTTSLAAYCTPGAEARTAVMAARCAAAIAWLKSPSQFGFAPSVTLLVLGPADWPRYAAPGEPYGMPHTSAGNTLVVAAGSNAVWENTLPPVASLPPATAEALATIYRNAQGQLSLEKVFDLLALHELGHLYFRQAKLSRPRYWLEEFFASLLLHSYIATHEPTQLPALEVYPQMVVDGTDPTRLPYHTLADFEQQYGRMEREQPQNYGWYQCRLHRAVARVYNANPDALLRLWQALHRKRSTYTDAELAAFLAASVSPTLAQVQTDW